MKRLLPFVYGQFHSRLLWPVMTYLLKWLIRPLDFIQRLVPITYRLPLFKEQLAFRGRTAFAIGMLLAGWLGATGVQAQSPGGVSTGLDFWFDPAANVTKTGAIVTSWGDKAAGGNGPVVTQATASLQPAYADGDVLSNYNPYINFAANDRLNQLVTGSAYSKSHTTFGVVNNYVDKGSYTHFIRFTNENNSDAGLHNWGLGHADSQTDKVAMHYITAPFSGGSGSAGTNPYNKFNSNRTITIGQSMLYGGLIDSSTPASTSVIITHNGNESNWTGATTLASLTPYNYLTIGGGNSFGMNNNKTQEIIHFSRALTLAERQRVNTYLGIKHGLTLEHNYLSGTGAIIYNIAGYSANVTGIGREDVQGLNQKQSRSVNSAGLVTIGNGTGIAATNALNSNSFSADASFEIIGDNGLAASYATAYLPNVYVSPVPSAFKLMSRIWKVQETGTVGTITVSVPVSSKAEVLLVSGSATFTPVSTTEITLISDGNGNMTAQVNLTDGQFFTFGSTVIAPGGVTADMQIWVKADNGVVASGSAVSQWTDQSLENHNLVQATAVNQPLLQGASTLFNFNPSVKFDGAGDRLAYKLTRFMSTTSSGTFFGAASNAVNGGYENLGDLGIDNPHMGTLANQQIMWMNSSAPVQLIHPATLTANKPTVLGYFWNGGTPNVGSGLRQNGTEYYNATTEATAVGNGGPADGQFTLGSYEGVENWNGHIAEAFLYSRNLTTQEKDRVDTYLAIKYGTTLTHNYLAANGTTIYNVASYSANITGIGRDDAQLLNQKQSKSINTEGLVTIGNGTGIAATNILNSNSFPSNVSFEIIGDNGLAASYATAYLPSVYVSPVPSAFKLMSRIWTVQETGTVGTVTISVPASSKAEVLLVSNSATFTPVSTTEITLTSDGNGNMTAQVNLTDGQFFTFGATVIAPGGVTADMQIWVKADNGVVTSGSAVSQWTDQSPENHNLVQATAANQPLLQGATSLFNFNPSVKFDGAGDRLAYKLTRFMSTTSSGTFYGAANNAVNGGYENLGDLGIDNPHMGTLANQQIMWMNSSAPVQINHPNLLTLNKPAILGYFWNGGSPDVGSGLRQNGTEYNIATTEATAVGNGGPADGQFTLGSYEGVENWNGHIAEAFLYSRNLTTQEKDRVDTYLSVKYGTTLTHNYLASDGATIYNVSSYSANITGIGRDNASGLHQKQSKSINAKSILTIGLGTALATTNAANANSFAVNNSFEIVGDNGQPYSYSTSYAPTSFTPAGGAGFFRMAATWRVQETGTVGTVVIGAASSTGADYLLVSNAATFVPASTTEIQLTPDGNGNLVATVDLTNGQFFTFGSAEKAPGGILAGLRMWLKADDLSGNDGEQVTIWPSSVLSVPFSVSQVTAAQRPTLGASTTALVNFNQSVNFKRSAVQDLTNSSENLLSGLTPSFHFIAVGKDMDPATVGTPWFGSGNVRALLGNGLGSNNPAMDMFKDLATATGFRPYSSDDAWWGGGRETIYNNGGTNRLTSQATHSDAVKARIANQQAQVFGIGFTWGAPSNVSGTLSTSFMNAWVDGYKEITDVNHRNSYLVPATAALTVGSSGGEFWNGSISEVINYTRELSDAEMAKVNTYLAIKYGTTLGQGGTNVSAVGSNVNSYSYVATDGTVIWNPSTNAGYNYDIAGIGQDNFEGLSQRQSKSVNGGFQPAIGLGTVELSNETNSGVFTTDKSYMVWGSNGLSSDYAVSYTPTSFTVAAPVYLMNRIWKVQETQTVGVVTVSIPGSSTGTYLLVANSPTSLTNGGATEYAMISDGNGNLTAQVNLADGQYFTFAKTQYAPGCVSANLQLWLKADLGLVQSGTAVGSWFDQAVGNNPTTVNDPGFVASGANFNPVVRFDGTNDRFDWTNFTSSWTAGEIFYMLKSNRATNVNNGLATWGNNHWQHYTWSDQNIFDAFGSTTRQVFNPSWNIEQYGIYQTRAKAGQWTAWYNGGQEFNDATNTVRFNEAATNLGFGNLTYFSGDIGEVVLYDRELTTLERQRVNSYLGIKYGQTLKHNYLAGNGTTIYNVSSYSANVTGIGRDDCQQLLQKQSKSVNPAAKLTIGLSGTVADTNADNPGSLTGNSAFLVAGDNGLTGLTSFSSVTTACPQPPASDKFTNLNYKFTETGSVPATFVQFDASGNGFNPDFPLYMQVATDAAFTNLLSSVPMSFSAGIGTTNYDFPANSTVYVRFAGNTTFLANICAAPTPQTFHWNGWWYGTKTKTITSNFGLNNTLANPVMSVTVTDGSPNVLLYRPSVDWWPVFDGRNIFIPRNDNNTASQETSVITTKMKFFAQSSLGVASTSAVAAQTVDFVLRDIDGYIGGKDIVKVYGKIGAATVFPKITKTNRYPGLAGTALTISGNTITAGTLPWDLTILGNAYVSFDSPVEEVYVEYTKDNSYNFRVYNDLRIGAVTVTCKPPVPRAPLADNVYIYKQATPTVQKTDEVVDYKFTIQNTDCANKVIDFTDALPGGLIWVDSTLVTSLGHGAVNNYGNNQLLTITSLTVTPGTSYLYMSVRGSVAGVYPNQASYVVTNGTGATNLSDDPSAAGTGMQPTSLTLIENDPDAQLAITKVVDKVTTAQNTVVTYSFTVSSGNSASAVLTTFQDVLPGELTFVANSLSGLSGGYTSSTAVSPYSGSATLTLRDLLVPAGGSVSFSIQANVNSYTIGEVASNVATATPDVSSGFRINAVNSNVVSTTIGNPPSLTINSPINNTQTSLNPTISGTATPGAVVSVSGGPGSTGGPVSVTADGSGNWSTLALTLPTGPNTITAIASNGAGSSTPATVNLTAVAPPTVAIDSPTNGQSLATSSPTLSGTATPGSNVTVTGGPGSSGGPVVVPADPTTGAWSTSALSFPSGSNSVSATAGNVGGTSTPTTVSFSVAAPLTVNTSPAALTTTQNTPVSASAAQAITPGGGTLPLTYSAFNPTSGSATSSTSISTPHGTATIDPNTGVYSYTPTPGYSGTDAIGIKVCDASSPTPQCVSSVIPINIAAPASGVGTLDCSTAQISGISAGTPGNGVLKLSINVTTAGPLPVTLSGSGLSASPSPYTINATATGAQTFYVPLSYSGAAFAAGTTITVTGAGVCTVDMTAVTPKTVSTSVLNLGPACTPATAATLIK